MKTQSIKKGILIVLLGLFGSAQAGLYDFMKISAAIVGSTSTQIATCVAEKSFRRSFETSIEKGNYGQAALEYGKSFAIGAAALVAAHYLNSKNSNFTSFASQYALETIGSTFIANPLLEPIITCGHKCIENGLTEATNDENPNHIKAACHYLASLGTGFAALSITKSYVHRIFKCSAENHARNFIIKPMIQLCQKYVFNNIKDQMLAPLALSLALSYAGY